MGQNSKCLLQNLADICRHMLELLISIRLLGHVIGTDIDENLGRFQIQKQRMDMLEKLIRIQAADTSIVDDVVDTSTPSDFTNGKKLHERGAREERFPLDSNLI